VVRISFADDRNRLETDLGSFDIQSDGFDAPTSSRPLVFIKRDWIFRGCERLLWIPPEYFVTCLAVRHDGLFTIGHGSGLVTLLHRKPC
jgi:hypothetical protein